MAWGHVSVFSLAILLTYAAGLVIARQTGLEAPWTPKQTTETVVDEPNALRKEQSLGRVLSRALAHASIVVAAGMTLAQFGQSAVDRTGFSENVVGIVFTSVTSSLPELVTTLALVRTNAVTMAVSGILGGNAFDALFIAASDVAYTKGSIFSALSTQDVLPILASQIMVSIVLLGLVRRERFGVGFESVAVVLVYLLLIASTVF